MECRLNKRQNIHTFQCHLHTAHAIKKAIKIDNCIEPINRMLLRSIRVEKQSFERTYRYFQWNTWRIFILTLGGVVFKRLTFGTYFQQKIHDRFSAVSQSSGCSRFARRSFFAKKNTAKTVDGRRIIYTLCPVLYLKNSRRETCAHHTQGNTQII